MLRILIAAATALAGLVFAVRGAFHGEYLGGISFFLAGALVAAAIVIGPALMRDYRWKLGALVFSALGFQSVLTETRGFDMERQALQSEIGLVLVEQLALPGNPWRLSQEDIQLARNTMTECMVQGARDLMQSTVAAGKAIHFGPGTTLGDATIQALDGNTPEERCLSGFAILYQARPLMFANVIQGHRAWLTRSGILSGG